MPSRIEDMTSIVVGKKWLDKARAYKINVSRISRESIIKEVMKIERTKQE